jgi:hypothetical protein
MKQSSMRILRGVSRHPIFPLFYLLLLLFTPLLMGAASFTPDMLVNNWTVGQNVGLSKGTQIREGPNMTFCFHTIVPEDNWTVQVIGGPTTDSAGNTWYNTSRAAAGDPSGGTGWVRQAQADASPAPKDPGTACPNSQALRAGLPITIETPKFLLDLKTWWSGQVLPVKIGVLVGALLLLIVVMRWADTDGRAGGVNGAVLGFARAILVGILLAGVADLTRSIWLSYWQSIAGGYSGIDPALVLLVLPVMWYVVSLILSAVGRTLALVIGVVQLVFLLSYLFPDRVNSILAIIEGWFGAVPR